MRKKNSWTVPLSLASATFTKMVAQNPDVSNATARIGAWIIGAAIIADEYPLELSMRQITEGMQRNNQQIKGTGCRFETVKTSLEWLQQNGVIKSKDGNPTRAGHRSRLYWVELQAETFTGTAEEYDAIGGQ